MKQYIFIYSADSGILKNIPGALAKARGRKSSCALCNITHGPLFEKEDWKEFVKSLKVPATILHRDEIPSHIRRYLDEKKIDLPVVLLQENDSIHAVIVTNRQLESCDGQVECLKKYFDSL